MVDAPPVSEVYPPYPGTWQEFCSWFADEQACAAYLERLRWPKGVRCPKCEQGKGWRTADGRWACSGCSRKVSVTAGTIFDRSRISLQEWFAAAWYMTNSSSSGDPAHVSMPGVHRIAALLKRWLLGTHQGSVTAAHLDAYLNEFAFRFNRRHSRRRGLLFLRLLQHAMVTQPTRYRPSRSRDSIAKHNM